MSKLLLMRLGILSYIESKLRVLKSDKYKGKSKSRRYSNSYLLIRLKLLQKVQKKLKKLVYDNRAELYIINKNYIDQYEG